MEGGDEQSAIETDRLIAAAMIQDPMQIMAMIREGEVMMTNSGAAASGLQRPKSEVRDPSEATMRERKRRQDEEDAEDLLRRAAAAAARRSPTRQRVNERGEAKERHSGSKDDRKRKDVISSDSDADAMEDGPSKADLARKLEQLEMVLTAQGTWNKAMSAHLQHAENLQALTIKLVRKTRETGSARQWHQALEKAATTLAATSGVVCCAKIEAELEIVCTCESTRQKMFEALKVMVRQDSDLGGGLVLLARPSLKASISKPTSWIYGWIKRKNGGRSLYSEPTSPHPHAPTGR